MDGFHGNHLEIRLSENQHYLAIPLLLYDLKRRTRYQISVFPEDKCTQGVLSERSLVLFLSLPGCHGNYRCAQKVPKVPLSLLLP